MTYRITQGMLTHRSVDWLQSSLGRTAKIQEQLSTGRVLNRPSDSPSGTTTAMRLRSELGDQGQYVRNAEDGSAWLDLIDGTADAMTTDVRRARDLAIRGASAGAATPAARGALAAEIDQIRESLLAQANTDYLGRPVFGGVTAGSKAFDDTGAYVGTPGPVMRTVADGIRVRVDVDGTDLVGPNGASLFDDLDALSDALRAGDDAGIGAGLDALGGRLEKLAAVRAQVGATQSRIEAASLKAANAELTLTQALSEVENTDLPRAIVDLKMQEVAYEAALAATGRVLQPSLVDFLR
ncbi:flagellin [Nocardioides dongkuii]|uniref:flagellin N-terminal helical domain-containing protein n=1 Tax=Nocardioides dongkuii TaxID=2760089 RepID=UPI0015F8C971|nr:flagellin [Nocardioides dongkuii]